MLSKHINMWYRWLCHEYYTRHNVARWHITLDHVMNTLHTRWHTSEYEMIVIVCHDSWTQYCTQCCHWHHLYLTLSVEHVIAMRSLHTHTHTDKLHIVVWLYETMKCVRDEVELQNVGIGIERKQEVSLNINLQKGLVKCVCVCHSEDVR